MSCGCLTIWANFRLTRDAPNTWPQHQYIALKALRQLPSNVSSGLLPSRPDGQSTFALVPAGQLGVNETELPGQPIMATQNATATGAGADINLLNGTVANGGNASAGAADTRDGVTGAGLGGILGQHADLGHEVCRVYCAELLTLLEAASDTLGTHGTQTVVGIARGRRWALEGRRLHQEDATLDGVDDVVTRGIPAPRRPRAHKLDDAAARDVVVLGVNVDKSSAADSRACGVRRPTDDTSISW